MEKAVLCLKEINITQGMNGSYSHNGELAIDIGGKCKWLQAPFTGTIKRIYPNTNTVWLESNEPVLYADGTIDYMTIMTHHDNDVSDLWEGKVINQGEIYYHPGTKGLSTGSHIHLAIGKGKYVSPGWYQGEYQPQINAYAWPIFNQYNVVDALFLYDKVEMVNPIYDWKITETYIEEPITPNVERDESKNQVEVFVDQLRVRKEPSLSGQILGFAKEGFYNVLEQVENDGYLWYKIADDNWIATNDEWTKYYPATDYKTLYEQELEKNKELEKEIELLKEEKATLQTKIDKAIQDLS